MPARLIVAFLIWVIRPAFYPFLIYSLIEIIITYVKGKISKKEKSKYG